MGEREWRREWERERLGRIEWGRIEEERQGIGQMKQERGEGCDVVF